MHTSVRSFVKLNRGKVIKESEIYRAEFCKGGEVNFKWANYTVRNPTAIRHRCTQSCNSRISTALWQQKQAQSSCDSNVANKVTVQTLIDSTGRQW